MKTTGITALFGLASMASAHYTFDKLLVNDQKVGGDNTYIRKHDRGYMPTKGTQILEQDFVCNQNAKAAPQVVTVKPGDKVGLQQAFGANGIQHPGPTQVYMMATKDAKAETGVNGDWFKVAQSLICKAGSAESLRTDAWCSWDENNVNFHVPDTIPDGEYLVRAEHIALHGAHAGQAEFYYACLQMKVQGSQATALPAMKTTKIPGVYAVKDKAINFSLWGRATSYPEIPGNLDVIPGGEIRGSADGKTGDKIQKVAGGASASSTPAETQTNNANNTPAQTQNNNANNTPAQTQNNSGNTSTSNNAAVGAKASCKKRRAARAL